MPASVKDIARLTGVSVTTVVRALKGRPDVSEQTRERVLEAARRARYQPNLLARSLVTQRTFTAGIVVPDLDNPFFPALLKGIEAALWEREYNVVLSDTNYDPEKEEAAIRGFLSRRVDGLIISPQGRSTVTPWFSDLAESGLPVVYLTKMEPAKVNAVFADDMGGAYAMTGHLLALGRRRILYAGNRLSAWANAERVAGFTAALDRAGVPAADRLVRLADGNSIESGYRLVRDALTAGDRPDAVFAFDDIMAIGARRALAEAGRRVPDDVALAGFDNIDLSALPEIDLTTVDIPKLDLGREAAALLLRLMEKRSGEPNGGGTNIILETRLVVRGSCGARLAGRAP